MKLVDATYDEDNNIVPSEDIKSVSKGMAQNMEESDSVIPMFLTKLGITDESLSFATGRVAGELVKFYDSIPENDRNSESIKSYHNDELVTLQNSISKIILEETSKAIDPSRISPKALESVLIEFADKNESIYDLPSGTKLVEVVLPGSTDSSEIKSTSKVGRNFLDSSDFSFNTNSRSLQDSLSVDFGEGSPESEDSDAITFRSAESESSDSSSISLSEVESKVEDSSEIIEGESLNKRQEDSSSIKFSSPTGNPTFSNSKVEFDSPEEQTDKKPFELFAKDISTNEFEKFEVEWKSYGDTAEQAWENVTSLDRWAQATVSVATPLTKSILESGLSLFSSVRGSDAARAISDVPSFVAGVINYTVTDPIARSVGRMATSIQRLFSVPDRFMSSATEFLRGKVSSAIRTVEDFVTNPIDRLSTSLESRITRLFEGPGVQFVSSATKAEFDKAMFNLEEPATGTSNSSETNKDAKTDTEKVINFDGEVSNKVGSDSISFEEPTPAVEQSDNIPFRKIIAPPYKLEGMSERKKAEQFPETEDLSLEFSEPSSITESSDNGVGFEESGINGIPPSEYNVSFDKSKINPIPKDEFSIVYVNKKAPTPPYTRQDLMDITDCQFSVDSFWNITLKPHAYGSSKPPELFKGRTLPVISFRLVGESLSNSQTQSYPGVSMSYPSRYSSASSVVISLPEVIIDNKLEIRTWIKDYLDYALCRDKTNPKSIKYRDMRKCSYEMTIQKYGVSWTELWKKEYLVIPEVSEDLNGESSPSAEITSISFNIIGENLQ